MGAGHACVLHAPGCSMPCFISHLPRTRVGGSAGNSLVPAPPPNAKRLPRPRAPTARPPAGGDPLRDCAPERARGGHGPGAPALGRPRARALPLPPGDALGHVWGCACVGRLAEQAGGQAGLAKSKQGRPSCLPSHVASPPRPSFQPLPPQRPEYLTAGSRFVFREGRTKGIGMVVGGQAACVFSPGT